MAEKTENLTPFTSDNAKEMQLKGAKKRKENTRRGIEYRGKNDIILQKNTVIPFYVQLECIFFMNSGLFRIKVHNFKYFCSILNKKPIDIWKK